MMRRRTILRLHSVLDKWHAKFQWKRLLIQIECKLTSLWISILKQLIIHFVKTLSNPFPSLAESISGPAVMAAAIIHLHKICKVISLIPGNAAETSKQKSATVRNDVWNVTIAAESLRLTGVVPNKELPSGSPFLRRDYCKFPAIYYYRNNGGWRRLPRQEVQHHSDILSRGATAAAAANNATPGELLVEIISSRNRLIKNWNQQRVGDRPASLIRTDFERL